MDGESEDAVGSGEDHAGLATASRRRCRLLVVLAVSGWLIALPALWWCWRTLNEVRFATATAVGLSEPEVRARAGPPDVVLSPGGTGNSGQLTAYEWPARRIEYSALVYFRFNYAIVVFIGHDGFVQAVYWARPRRAADT